MIRCGVIGHPISHSKSPLIHTHWMTQHHIDGEYGAIDIAPENLTVGVQGLVDEGYAGFNVTVPHKVAIMALCDEIDDTARAIGAVNTVVIKGSKLWGRNTDAFGFMENLKAGWTGAQFDRPVMVLGAGGAARAVVYALLQEGVRDIRVSNRSSDKADALCELGPANMTPVSWDARGELADIGLLVNTTSLGMKNQPPLEIDLHTLPVSAGVYDIVYAPLMTDLLVQAQDRGNPVITGIGMLLHQARPAFEAWCGVLPEVDAALEAKVLP